MDRRTFLLSSMAAAAFAVAPRRSAAEQAWHLRIGVTDWDLLGRHYMRHHTPNPHAISLAKRLGFDGIEINLGRRPDRIPLADPSLQQNFLDASAAHDLPIASTCLDILHQNYLKSDPLGEQWVAESIPITKNLSAKVILLPFFGDGGLDNHEEIDRVADILRDHAPAAAEAGVILGVENTLSARDNARLLDRADHPAVRIYYDVGNSSRMGYDVIEEIRWLGAERICQFHIKDNPHYLGEGDLDFEAVAEAIADIGYDGWGMLETAAPSGDFEADMQRNLHFIRDIIEQG